MKTLPRFFENHASRYAGNILIWEKKTDKYTGTPYAEIQRQVHLFAAGLMSLGLNKGDKVTLLSEGRNNWLVSELGILYAGAVNVPLSVKLSELPEISFRINHSESKFVIVSGSQLQKIRDLKSGLLQVERYILLDNPDVLHENEILFADVMKSGDDFLSARREEFVSRRDSVHENDFANICYTSGTTADPKGILLTHLNYVTNIDQACDLMEIPQHFVTLVILPWDHAFAHTAGLYCFIKNGAGIASIQTGKTPLETLKNIPVNMKEVRPHIMMSVPALAKNFKKNIEAGIAAKGPKVEKLFAKALCTAISYNGDGWNKGKGFQLFNKLKYKLFDKIIFSKIRENFGGRLQFFIGGGALLDLELQKFFYAIGMPMFQGYGLTEAAPIISANAPLRHKLGSSGFIVNNLELKIIDEKGNSLPAGEKGEIIVKGDNVMAGYWKNEKATSEALRDGWLYTGDLGYLDPDGFLYVLGRSKSLLIASDGEKYSPEGIEEALIEKSPVIDQCMLYNNQDPFTVGLIVPNTNNLKKLLKEKNITFDTAEGKKYALEIIRNDVNQFREGGKFGGLFPQRWLPSAIAILDEPFTEQNKLMNSTLKIVRGKITEHYKDRITFLFTAEGKDFFNKYNLEALK